MFVGWSLISFGFNFCFIVSITLFARVSDESDNLSAWVFGRISECPLLKGLSSRIAMFSEFSSIL